MEGVLETGLGESGDTVIGIVHTHSDTTSLGEVADCPFGWLGAVFGLECHLESTSFLNNKISSLVLISKSMSTNNNSIFPTWNEKRYTFDENRFTEYCSLKEVSDLTVWRFIHSFKIEFFYYSTFDTLQDTWQTLTISYYSLYRGL